MTVRHPLPKSLTEVRVLKTVYGSVDRHKHTEPMRSIIGVADALPYTLRV